MTEEHHHTSLCDNPNCRDAADLAVKKVFAILGVDVDKPESVEEFRADLRFGKKMRRLADHGTMALIGAMFLGLGALAWVGLADKLRGVFSHG